MSFKMLLTNFRKDGLYDYVWRYYDKGDKYVIEYLLVGIQKATRYGFIGYWNNDKTFENTVKTYFEQDKGHYFNHNVAQFVLWVYENSKRSGSGNLWIKNRMINIR